MNAPIEFPVVNATPLQVAEARRLRRLGWSYASISRRYGLKSDREAAVLVGDKPEQAGR